VHPQVRQQGSGGSEAQLSTEVKAIRPCFHHLVHRLRFIFGVLLFGKTIKKTVVIYVNKQIFKNQFKNNNFYFNNWSHLKLGVKNKHNLIRRFKAIRNI
jgi:hypothetical protein